MAAPRRRGWSSPEGSPSGRRRRRPPRARESSRVTHAPSRGTRPPRACGVILIACTPPATTSRWLTESRALVQQLSGVGLIDDLKGYLQRYRLL